MEEMIARAARATQAAGGARQPRSTGPWREDSAVSTGCISPVPAELECSTPSGAPAVTGSVSSPPSGSGKPLNVRCSLRGLALAGPGL